ncbi:hypothetical protein [Noviluteimonas dokdonensis]|uniref:hypothetical protein n=1 Tax=Noviluteimonas dokdonensis TaxID=414050 RepID=UPI0005630360|nr:hypothetical protein [Lysobacter dokdonensis]
MLSELIEANGNLLVPLALLVAIATLAKGIFGLHRSRSADRKDFLELWRGDHPDDLWLEVAVRHLVGEYMPAPIIRMLWAGPQAGRALMEVAECWPLFEFDPATNGVRWRSTRYSTSRKRFWWRATYWAAYLISMGIALLLALPLIGERGAGASLVPWVFVLAGAVVGLSCAYQADRLATASKSGPKWLALP